MKTTDGLIHTELSKIRTGKILVALDLLHRSSSVIFLPCDIQFMVLFLLFAIQFCSVRECSGHHV